MQSLLISGILMIDNCLCWGVVHFVNEPTNVHNQKRLWGAVK